MAEWLSKEKVFLGDAFGNAREVWIGVVKVNKRTTIGLQFNINNRDDLPDYTLDGQATIDFSGQLVRQLPDLAAATGGGFQ